MDAKLPRHVIQPAPEALARLNAYHNSIVERRRGEFADVSIFAARWCENAWRVALVLHAGLHGADAHNHSLDAETAANAVRIVEWFAAQQLDILAKGRRATARKVEEEVLELIERNLASKRLDFSTAREVQRERIAATADGAKALLDRMQRDGLLIGEDIRPPHGGKITRIFRRVQNPVPE